MHTHTAPTSRCAVMTPEELAEALNDGGYSGAVLTNHFLHGNTGVDRALPWEDFVREYERDYLACRAAAEKYGLDILFGVEEHVSGGLEILVYGITPDVLYSHPELAEWDVALWHDVITSHGGVVIQAHPYRSRSYIDEPGVLPLENINGIEVYNLGNDEVANIRAAAFATTHGELILTSGADTHSFRTVCYAGIEAPYRIKTEAELAKLLRSGGYNILS